MDEPATLNDLSDATHTRMDKAVFNLVRPNPIDSEVDLAALLATIVEKSYGILEQSTSSGMSQGLYLQIMGS